MNLMTNEIPKEKGSVDSDGYIPSLRTSDEETTLQNSDVRVNSNGIGMGESGIDEGPPDGDDIRAWMITLGAMCSSFASFGFVNSWGVFQAYYEEVALRTHSPSTISWIGSIGYALVFFPGLIVGRLFDLGYCRSLYFGSGLLLVIGTVLTGQCNKYWEFLICQGIIAGVGCGGLFTCSNAVVAHWFKKKRGRTMGFMAVGSGLSGATIPIIVKALLPVVGFPWTMRILGFIFLLTTMICNMTMRPRLPPKYVKGGLFNISMFRNKPYTVYCISSLITNLGIFAILTYVSVSATNLGSTPELAFYFVTFLNTSSILGRWTAGVLSDRIGTLNVTSPCAIIAGAVTYAWPFTRSTNSLVAVAVIYGFCCGAFVSVMPKPAMNFGGEEDVGRRVGMYQTIMAFGTLAGPPIAGAIISRTGGYEVVGIYAGSVVMLGSSLMLLVRYLVLGTWFGKV